MKKIVLALLAATMSITPVMAKGKTNSDVSVETLTAVQKVIPLCNEYLKVQAQWHMIAFLKQYFKDPAEVQIAAMICHAYRTGYVDHMLQDGEGS